ncbi:MAG: MerR family transcriptional regulator [Acidimicrobiia bacterium]|nr:MerR family transcriptional regulator [Acidimicrobiia bacterium]
MRVLRHYDEIGLLKPATVDPQSGYRWYGAPEIARLHRIVALKELGLTLNQVNQVLNEDLSPQELRGMLRLRQADLLQELAQTQQRLQRIETRINYIEQGDIMVNIEVTLKRVEPVVVAVASATAASFSPVDVGPALSPLYRPLFEQVEAAGLRSAGPPIAFYEDAPDGDGIVVNAAVPISAGDDSGGGVELRSLPALDQVAAAVHHGSMQNCETTIGAMFRWISDNGLKTLGYSREIYLDCPDDVSKWVTEIQFPVAPV